MSDDTFLGAGPSPAGDDSGTQVQAGADVPAAAPAGGWLAGLSEDLRGLAAAKGWAEPADALKSYQNLESIFGADKAGRTLHLPRDNGDTEALEAIYKAMGRPDEPGGYELGKVLAGEAVDDNFMGLMSTAMHEAGLSSAQAGALARAWQDHYNEVIGAAEAGYRQALEEAARTIPPADLETARRGVRLAGLSQSDIRQIEQVLGPVRAAEAFKNIGQKLTGDRMAEGASGLGGPAGAKAEIARLKTDSHFMSRYMNSEQSALDRMTELHRQAEAE